ncbi:MAG: tRNA preQ1(34) S-adenosylmethionine ribosyltransferase-isomerase QueA [Candidatus Thermoplasmatota archaeon]|nr:tRNA preQ1(34) S-adenosylmethionine ribosyltransferase-isomerase QueA [Candidatus Thermoplasmatota archaeon]
MKLDLFDYDLPKERIAQSKSDPRDASRLFFIDNTGSDPVHEHHRFRDIVNLLDEGDLLVLNRSRVIPARIPATKTTGGKAEVLLLERKGRDRWDALVGGKRIREGEHLLTGDEEVKIQVLERIDEGKCSVCFIDEEGTLDHSRALEWLNRWGLMPTPPYIKRMLDDPEEYQTVYGDIEGSVAAPTAGLHFTEDLLVALKRKGIRIAYIILHVGMGTFAPVKSDNIKDHIMEEEEFFIPDSVKDAIKDAVEETRESENSRIWVVGTTVMRSLESAFNSEGDCVVEKGRTGLYITPGYKFKLPYKGFITNFHLPRSTPLILVSAFFDREKALEAYREAVKMRYRFYSLGDSMMIRRS